MECKKAKILHLFVLLGMVTTSKGVEEKKGHIAAEHKKSSVTATARGYIEIDGSDPFNIPKHSEYVKGPPPEDIEDDGNRPQREHRFISPKRNETTNTDDLNLEDNADNTENEEVSEREKPNEKVDPSPKEEVENILKEDYPKEEYTSKEDSSKNNVNEQDKAPVSDIETTKPLVSPNEMEDLDNSKSIQSILQDIKQRQESEDSSNEES